MPIATVDEVRKLSGNRSVENLPDAEIVEQIEASDNVVKLSTGKTDWVSTDLEWPVLKQASELLAASWIRQRFKEKDESDKQYREAFNLIEIVNRKSAIAGAREVIIKRARYKTFPANQQGTYYSSIHKKHLTVGGGEAEGSAELGPGWFF